MNIPPAALEAGARAIAATDCPASLFDTCESQHGGCMCREQARAACRAMLTAWPGMLADGDLAPGENGPPLHLVNAIILPLTEKTDDKA